MAANTFPVHSTALSIAGGTLLGIAGNITHSDLLKTAVLAALGAAVSFFISLALKWLIRYFNGDQDQNN